MLAFLNQMIIVIPFVMVLISSTTQTAIIDDHTLSELNQAKLNGYKFPLFRVHKGELINPSSPDKVIGSLNTGYAIHLWLGTPPQKVFRHSRIYKIDLLSTASITTWVRFSEAVVYSYLLSSRSASVAIFAITFLFVILY